MYKNELQHDLLKLCPFCGGQAELSTWSDESLWSHAIVPYYQISCLGCEVQTHGSEVRREVVEGWNMRVEPTVEEMLGRFDTCEKPVMAGKWETINGTIVEVDTYMEDLDGWTGSMDDRPVMWTREGSPVPAYLGWFLWRRVK